MLMIVVMMTETVVVTMVRNTTLEGQSCHNMFCKRQKGF